MQYRKRPVVIDAFKLGINYMPDWFMDALTASKVVTHRTAYGRAQISADIETLEGWIHASHGDYIIRGVKGEIYACKPDIFEMTYECME